MKKITFLAFCCVCIIAFNSCGGSGEKDTIRYGWDKQKNYNKVDKAIQECLDNFDFEAAHKIINEIPVDAVYDYDVDKLSMKVYRNEITYLVDQNTDELWEKAFILIVQYQYKSTYRTRLHEFENKVELCDLLSKYAIAFGHVETAQRLCRFLEVYIKEGEAEEPNYSIFDDEWHAAINKAKAIKTSLSSVE